MTVEQHASSSILNSVSAAVDGCDWLLPARLWMTASEHVHRQAGQLDLPVGQTAPASISITLCIWREDLVAGGRVRVRSNPPEAADSKWSLSQTQ